MSDALSEDNLWLWALLPLLLTIPMDSESAKCCKSHIKLLSQVVNVAWQPDQ
jgi:hypothetical protein